MTMRASEVMIKKYNALIGVVIGVPSNVALSATSKTSIESHGLRLAASHSFQRRDAVFTLKEVSLILRGPTI
jgi:hypothetical protein